jgi:hypothetical protein
MPAADYDSDTAFKRIRNLWRRLGGLYEKAAYEAMQRGNHGFAMDHARKAEVCFWQATGEGDQLDMKSLGYGSKAEA